MADLAYNVDTLRGQARKIAEIREGLQSAKDDLSSQLDALRSDWDSDAGDKFFENYDTDWVNHVDQYCYMLDDLANALNDAARHGIVGIEIVFCVLAEKGAYAAHLRKVAKCLIEIVVVGQRAVGDVEHAVLGMAVGAAHADTLDGIVLQHDVLGIEQQHILLY